MEQALEDVKTADARFRARIPELREGFQKKAEERAEQAIAEIRRRHAERRAHLDEDTARRRERAVSQGTGGTSEHISGLMPGGCRHRSTPFSQPACRCWRRSWCRRSVSRC